MQAVADFYGDMIDDNLLQIDSAEFPGSSWSALFFQPTTGQSIFVPDLVVPEDVIIVYVGARELGGSTAGSAGFGVAGISNGSDAWKARLRGRGSAGAAILDESDRTDFSLWGGSIAFDTPRTWNFSQTGNGTGTEFITVALHEMGHVLGIGTAPTWDNQLAGGFFRGSAASRSFGGAPAASSAHYSGSLRSPLFGSFAVPHGLSRPVVMSAILTDNGSNFDVVTDLDLATLVDIGWQLSPPTRFASTALSPIEATFTWQSVSFKNYELQRSMDLVSFPNGSGFLSGDGSSLSYSDPSPPTVRAFYRLATSDATVAVADAARVQEKETNKENVTTTTYEDAFYIKCCEFHE